MKLFAQHGYGKSDKIESGLEEGLIDGVIFEARYLHPDKAKDEIGCLQEIDETVELMIDPEYYASAVIDSPNAQLGYLEDWGYFSPLRIIEFVTNPTRVDKIVHSSLDIQEDVGATTLIAPSVYISQSLDSMESALALSFLRKAVSASEKRSKKVLSTLSLNRDALLNSKQLIEFVDALTGMSKRPSGVYLTVGVNSSSGNNGLPSPEIFDLKVLAAWMYLNYALSINGIRVINGFSDLLSPFLGVAGGDAGATGWWSNLQCFSIDRYIRSEDIRRRPLRRYLSMKLMARINARDMDAFVALRPEIANQLPHDRDYEEREPDRTSEMLQTWEALAKLLESVDCKDVTQGIRDLSNIIETAHKTWAGLREREFTQGQESVDEYLEQLEYSLDEFQEMAEL